MAQINKPSDYFNTVLYSGNGGTQSIVTGFAPDLVWVKCRSNIEFHWWNDTIRGATKTIHSNSTNAESTQATSITSLDSDGFTLGSDTSTNGSGKTFASWNWLGGGTASSNTDGSITSTVSANTTSGFSIVSWTGTGANATVGHGLGVVPKITIVKGRDAVTNWIVGGSLIEDVGGSTNNYMILNGTAAMDTSTDLYASYNTDTIGVKTDANINGSGQGMIMYCFAEKKGFSKFGSYTGNGNADGTFVYTGFKPAFVLIKQTNTAREWYIFDNKRDAFNPEKTFLEPSTSDADATVDPTLDFVSNGFKYKTANAAFNDSGGTFIYMCFAENPLVSTAGVPCTAR